MSIKIIVRGKYRYLVGMKRSKFFFRMPDLLFGSTPFNTILILGRFDLGMKFLAWYIDPNGIEKKIHYTPIPYW